MAKSQTARSTIKNDPFATLIPDREAEHAAEAEEATETVSISVVTPLRREQAPSQAPSVEVESKKKGGDKITVHLSPNLIERLRNAAYWNPELTIAGIAELGVKYALELVEKEHGGPYPKRKGELKGGRPIGS